MTRIITLAYDGVTAASLEKTLAKTVKTLSTKIDGVRLHPSTVPSDAAKPVLGNYLYNVLHLAEKNSVPLFCAPEQLTWLSTLFAQKRLAQETLYTIVGNQENGYRIKRFNTYQFTAQEIAQFSDHQSVVNGVFGQYNEKTKICTDIYFPKTATAQKQLKEIIGAFFSWSKSNNFWLHLNPKIVEYAQTHLPFIIESNGIIDRDSLQGYTLAKTVTRSAGQRDADFDDRHKEDAIGKRTLDRRNGILQKNLYSDE